MYYAIDMSVSSLHRESTDSLITTMFFLGGGDMQVCFVILCAIHLNELNKLNFTSKWGFRNTQCAK